MPSIKLLELGPYSHYTATNQIGDEGIHHLCKGAFPNMKTIVLSNAITI